MTPKTERYETKENLTITEVEEYISFYDEYKCILPHINDRFKAAELKLEALKKNTDHHRTNYVRQSTVWNGQYLMGTQQNVAIFKSVYHWTTLVKRTNKQDYGRCVAKPVGRFSIKNANRKRSKEIPLTKKKLTLAK